MESGEYDLIDICFLNIKWVYKKCDDVIKKIEN